MSLRPFVTIARRTGAAFAIVMAGALALPAVSVAKPTREEALKMKNPGESDDAAANRLNEEGKALVRKKSYVEALAKFQAALELFPLANAIFNVSLMHYTLGELEQAFPYLEQTLRAPLTTEQRDLVLKYRADVLEKLKNSHKDILVQSNPPGAAVQVNGVAMPYAAPTRVLVPYGTADLTFSYPGFESKSVVIQSSPTNPPKDVAARLKREDPMAAVMVRCPRGSDVFIDGTMKGFDVVRDRLLAGAHTVRCGKGAENEAFERPVFVQLNNPNNFDFSGIKK